MPLPRAALRPSAEDVGEGVADERGHLADEAAAPGAQLESVEEDGQVEGVGHVAAEGFGEGALAGPDVAGEHEQRGAISEQRQRRQLAAVVLLWPRPGAGSGRRAGDASRRSRSLTSSSPTSRRYRAARTGSGNSMIGWKRSSTLMVWLVSI